MSNKQVFVAPVEALRVREWHPTPDASGPPTQVHLVVEDEDGPVLVVRFKSRASLHKLVAALGVHGANVFGGDRR